MKVGVLIDELIQGGFQKVALMEVVYLTSLGIKADLVVINRTSEVGYEDLINKYHVNVVFLSDRFPQISRINFKFPLFSFFSFFHIYYPFLVSRYLGKYEYDMFLVHGTYTAFTAILLKKTHKIQFISFIHDSISYILVQKYEEKALRKLFFVVKPLGNLLDKWIIKNSRYVVAFPKMIDVMKKTVPEYDKFVAIFNGCEPVSKLSLPKKRESFAIAVTKWDQGKNFEFLVDIWKDLSIKIPLRIIGSFYPDSLLNVYKNYVKSQGLEKDIQFIGSVNDKTLYDYYLSAKLLVHPCKEAFGMTILEASSCGCPGVFSKNSGVAELFPTEIYERLPNENNKSEFIFLIEKIILYDDTTYQNLSQAYYNTSVENSWKNHCLLLKNLMEISDAYEG